jgi:hypothetical protein
VAGQSQPRTDVMIKKYIFAKKIGVFAQNTADFLKFESLHWFLRKTPIFCRILCIRFE